MENFEQNQNYEIIKEKMKERPINRKKLMRRTMITLSMAVIFGIFACLTFLLLEPVFSNLLYPEPEPELVELPEYTDEMLPEDMFVPNATNREEIVVTSKKTDDEYIDEYTVLMQKIYSLTKKSGKSIVKDTAVSQDVDWFNNESESKGQTQGLIVANKNKELYVLVSADVVEKAEKINVSFQNGVTAEGNFLQKDKNTGLAIMTVSITGLSDGTIDGIEVARLGSSKSSALLATPVIAVGNPLGTSESIAYGMITSKASSVNMIDCNYELITTDIYGSEKGTGFLFNFSGEVLGVINQSYNSEHTKNIVSAIGISELKNTIEKMSNGRATSYFGIYGTDVTSEANETLGVPMGAYVTEIELDSPAMRAGIQSGDVITSIDGVPVESFSQYVDMLALYKPEDTISVTINRQSSESYQEIVLDITLGKR